MNKLSDNDNLCHIIADEILAKNNCKDPTATARKILELIDSQIISYAEWERLTGNAINNVVEYFKPKEIQTLLDFLATVTSKDLQGKGPEQIPVNAIDKQVTCDQCVHFEGDDAGSFCHYHKNYINDMFPDGQLGESEIGCLKASSRFYK